jgi:hypothetical protein
MSFVVHNKETGLYAKIKKSGWPRSISWVELSEATTFRNKGAALISCGKRVRNPNRNTALDAFEELRRKFTAEHGPQNLCNRKTNKHEAIKPAWPNSVKEKYEVAYRKYSREPFSHMVLSENLEILPVGVVLK